MASKMLRFASGSVASARRATMPLLARSFASSPVTPKFWTGKNAVSEDDFTIDCRDYNLPSSWFSRGFRASSSHTQLDPETPPEELGRRMLEVYKEKGVVRLTNTGLTDLTDMQRYAMLALQKQMVYEAGANRREAIHPNIFEVGAPQTAWLHYHHEMAYVEQSCRNIAFCCAAAADGKGDTFLSENLQVTDELMQTELGRKLRDLGVRYERNLTDHKAYMGQSESNVYNHWQISLGVDTPEEAERAAAAAGLSTEWATDPIRTDSTRYLKTIYQADAFEYCEASGRNVLYSSLADHNMWFDAWPGVRDVPKHIRPLQMTYGDGTEFTPEEIRTWIHLYDRGGIRVRWNVGDIVVLCNKRFAHGRPGYSLEKGEKRELGVLLGEKFQRQGAIHAAW